MDNIAEVGLGFAPSLTFLWAHLAVSAGGVTPGRHVLPWLGRAAPGWSASACPTSLPVYPGRRTVDVSVMDVYRIPKLKSISDFLQVFLHARYLREQWLEQNLLHH